MGTFIGKCLLSWWYALKPPSSCRWTCIADKIPFFSPSSWMFTFLCFATLHAMLAAYFIVASCLAARSALKTEVICSSKMSADSHRFAWHYIPKDSVYCCYDTDKNTKYHLILADLLFIPVSFCHNHAMPGRFTSYW